MADKVSVGQTFRDSALGKASFVNELVDIVGERQRRALGGGIGDGSIVRASDYVEVRNKTEENQVAGAVLQLGDHLLDDQTWPHPWFEAKLPGNPAHLRYAILLDPLEKDKIGPVQIAGVCLAKVNVGHLEHTHAIPTKDSNQLQSAPAGPIEILSKIEETGEKTLWVRLAVTIEALIGKADSAVAARNGDQPGTGTMKVWRFNGTSWAGTTMTQTVKNFASSPALPNRFLQAKFSNGHWPLDFEDC